MRSSGRLMEITFLLKIGCFWTRTVTRSRIMCSTIRNKSELCWPCGLSYVSVCSYHSGCHALNIFRNKMSSRKELQLLDKRTLNFSLNLVFTIIHKIKCTFHFFQQFDSLHFTQSSRAGTLEFTVLGPKQSCRCGDFEMLSIKNLRLNAKLRIL